MKIFRRKARPQPRPDDLTAFLDEGSEIDGRYTFRGTAMLNGRFTGQITTSDTLIIGEKGEVKATIHAATIIVSGEVSGEIVATQRLELRPTARVFAEVEAASIVVDEGAVFDGRCRMAQERAAVIAPARDLAVAKA
jgi:cytoskeletal protein CcmA (bactofilin family)